MALINIINSTYGEVVPPPANIVTLSNQTTVDASSLKWPSTTLGTNTYITTDNTSGSIWNTGTYTSTTDTIWVDSTHTPQSLNVEGDANFEGDVKIKGKSLVQALEKIEEKLGILHPNPDLEEKWENLRTLRKMYMDLEKEIIEKEKIYSILKK